MTQKSSHITFNPERPIRVGIIGASTEGWARTAHLPAIATIPGLEVSAVSTTRMESARETAREFGVPEAHDNAADLIASDSVDAIILAVRVEHHLEILQQIAAAGKPVYSEWPSGSNLEQTTALRDAFASQNVLAVTGLQARATPGFRFVGDLVRDGYIGRVLSTTLVGVTDPWGDVVVARNAYLQNDDLGGTMTNIPFGHTIDGICSVLGEFESLTAMTAIQQPEVRIKGTDQTVTKTTPDQLILAGKLSSGAMLSAHYWGGTTTAEPLRWQIDGTEGTILITAPNANLQLSPMTIHASTTGEESLRELEIPASYIKADSSLSSPAATVAESLLMFEEDLRNGTQHAPNLDHAVMRKQMLQDLRHAAETGTTRSLIVV